MKGTCEQIPFHFFLKFMMLSLSGDAVCSYVANASDFLYNIHKDYGEKGVLIRK